MKYAIVTAVLVLLVSTASADETTKTNYTFTDADEVQGDRPAGAGGITVVRRSLSRSTLIEPRTQFVAELLKSVESL